MTKKRDSFRKLKNDFIEWNTVFNKKIWSETCSESGKWKNELNFIGPCLFIWISIGLNFGWSCVRPIGSACALRIVIISIKCLPNLEVKVRFKWVKVRSMRNVRGVTASGLTFQKKQNCWWELEAISNFLIVQEIKTIFQKLEPPVGFWKPKQ